MMWVLSMLLLTLAGLVTALQCPGGQVCDDGYRCCRFPGTESSCCPQGVEQSLPMVKAGSINELSENPCSTNISCPSEYSCLRTSARSYSCCPLLKAVSCADGRHCCPQGSLCSLDGKLCLLFSGNGKIGAVICPDGELECPEQTTCCLTADGSWGCCPLPQAVCCEDKAHCCPQGTTCDLVHAKCLSAEGSKPMWSKFPARKRVAGKDKRVDTSGNGKCQDGSSCPDWTTCCQEQQSPKFGCCPMPNAVCCTDHIHCCPEGTKCDLTHSMCVNANGKNQSQLLMKTLALAVRDKVVKCDDSIHCSDGQTCCRLPSEEWGCCPYVEAVCCSDHIHCCPKGHSCNTAKGTCEQSALSIPWAAKSLAHVRETVRSKDVPCDETVSCPDKQTCCRMVSGEWGCCPIVEAVCCSDHVHCCPKGYTCNTAEGSCQQSALSIPWTLKTPAQVRVTMINEDVPCDDETSCEDGQTCCRTGTGKWACCPLPEAVCCSDHIHCCPNGCTCNTETGTCEQSSPLIPWAIKSPARTRATVHSKDVKCDDETSCADGQTCCRTTTGEWACCPLPEAVCCSDHIHCCPTDYTCNTAAGTCDKSALSIPWTANTPARVREMVLSKDVKCDDEASCADGQTCCRIASGDWGCCPLPEAVCCSDHTHCCPTGYTCNTTLGTCDRSALSIPWTAKTPARVRETMLSKDIKCDDEASCADGQTCCRAAPNWACCPLPEAVCCSDHIHCCPAGYTCNTTEGSCQKNSLSIPWVRRLQAQLTKRPQNIDVKCNDTASCKEGQTCCRAQSGDWNCCQLPSAVCCEDHLHCCPSGYTCNLAAQTCDKQDLEYPWGLGRSVMLLSPKDATEHDVKCDDAHYCKSGQTCCKTTTPGSWACCPYDQGVCCKDNRHCCPVGSKCSHSGERCFKSKTYRWDENFSKNRQHLDML